MMASVFLSPILGPRPSLSRSDHRFVQEMRLQTQTYTHTKLTHAYSKTDGYSRRLADQTRKTRKRKAPETEDQISTESLLPPRILSLDSSDSKGQASGDRYAKYPQKGKRHTWIKRTRTQSREAETHEDDNTIVLSFSYSHT